MRKMNPKEKKHIELEIYKIMNRAISSEYTRYILEQEDELTESTFMEDVIEDVMETSAWEDEGYYNEDDIRLAIGRVFIDRLGIIY